MTIFKVPHILTSLQKSVHAVLLGKTILPDWFNSGVKESAKVATLSVKPSDTGELWQKSLRKSFLDKSENSWMKSSRIVNCERLDYV